VQGPHRAGARRPPNPIGQSWRPVDELVRVGPLTVTLKLPEGVAGKRLLLAASGETATPVRLEDGWAQFELKSILDHEVGIVE
jgi:hypothetical protein